MLASMPPGPRDESEVPRWQHTALRRRLLYSQHGPDLRRKIVRNAGPIRAAKWGDPDLTANAFVALWSQVAAMYNAPPDVSRPEGGGESFLGVVLQSGYWSLMQRIQRDTLGLREMHLRVDIADGKLVLRPVFPDLAECKVAPEDPRTPVEICETTPHGDKWVRLIASVEDPSRPVYRAEATDGQDVSEMVIGSAAMEGDAYPWRYADGTPYLPYVTYHAAETAKVYDPFTMREVVEGSLNIGMGMTYFWHITRDAAFSQRYAFGVDIAGGSVGDDGSGESTLVADPATVLQGSYDPESPGQPLVGQWAVPVKPMDILDAVLGYERRVLLMAGLAPPDVSRQEADIRSGYSLAVQREDIRRKQVLYEPQFRRADEAFLRMAAAMLNTSERAGYAEDGYRIEYKGLPPSPLEQRAQREDLFEKMDRGMLSPQEVYMELNPGVTFEQANEVLTRNAQARRQFSA